MSTAPSRGPRNTIIQASAGTGKTFQLTNRYLSLLFEGQDPEHILATTFTRKAAGEILERVLLRLAAAATDSKKAAKLAGEIGRKDATQTRCLELFHHLLRRLHRLRIGTLDSFFTQIARSFALELGLPPGWTIVDEMDDARLRLEAIDDVLSGDEPQALATLLHLLAKGESKRGIEQLIEGVVNGLYPLYCEAPREAWFSLQRRKPLDGAELEEAVNQLRAQVLPGSMGKTRDSDIQLIESAEWDELLKKGLTPKVLDGSCVFSRKEIPAEACAIYARVIDHIRALVIDTLAMQTESSHALLERFDEHYRRRKVEQRVRRFDDITRSVSQPASLPGGEGVAFRLDAPVEHLLIDEFQDTSPAQWQALSPMAQHAARGASGSFFCVGDMKQAIYAWRGGVAEIFHAAQSQVPDVSLQSLAKSWRSSRPVIDAVNQVFTQLDKHPNLKHAASAARDWVRVFPFHSTAKIELPGHVSLSFSPAPKDGEKPLEACFRGAAARIAEEIRRAPWASVGVLLRSNKGVARMIYELHALKIPASEEGGNTLIDSAAVQLLLSLLTMADHPGHTAARFHVARSPLGTHWRFEDFRDSKRAAAIAREIRLRLQTEGYGKTFDEWSRVLAPACDARETSRLMQLVELGFEWDSDATLRCDDFIAFVQTQRVGDPSATPVRVTTVHQSKGLEFDIVYLPELTGKLVGMPGEFAARRPDPASPPDRIVRYVGEKQRQLLPQDVQEMFSGMAHTKATESFCTLYVAMTRAVHALHMIVPYKEKEKNLPGEFGGVLRAALAPDVSPVADGLIWETGNRDWMSQPGFEPPAPPPTRDASLPDRVVLAASPPEGRRSLSSVAPSALAHVKVDLADLLSSEARPALERGTLTHRWMEEIVWIDAGLPSREALLAAAAEGDWMAIRPADCVAEFLADLKKPGIAAMFRQAEYRKSAAALFPKGLRKQIESPEVFLRVERERDFWVRDEEQMVTGSIDRLIVFEREGKPIAAEIIDFKTDRASPGDAGRLAEFRDRYRPQLAAYCRSVAQMLQLPEEHVVARLLVTQAGKAIQV